MCFGPVTQGDCGASCLNVNIPCRGCGGPIPGIKDFGARCVSTLASSMANDDGCRSVHRKIQQYG
jgi:F420-non-reducing hydrogenase small subunit